MGSLKFKSDIPLFRLKWNELNSNWPNKFVEYRIDSNGNTPQIILLLAEQDCRTLYKNYIRIEDNDLKNIYENAKQLSAEHREVIKNFAREISCFAKVNFVLKTETFLSAANYNDKSLKVTICYVNGLREKYNQDGRMSSFTENYPVKKAVGGLIFLDEGGVKHYNKLNIEINNINTLMHEMLHILGLTHPKYNSIQEHLAYRSILEPVGAKDNFLYQDCLAKKTWLAPTFECYDLPIKLTPVDVKGLISVWGESDDNSGFCQNIRAQFIDEYGSDYLN